MFIAEVEEVVVVEQQRNGEVEEVEESGRLVEIGGEALVEEEEKGKRGG